MAARELHDSFELNNPRNSSLGLDPSDDSAWRSSESGPVDDEGMVILQDSDFTFADDEITGIQQRSPQDDALAALYESLSPPERVRFAAPVTLRPEGDDTAYDGAVVNLSKTGLACLAPIPLATGDRVWATFRLSLADEPMTLLCEVIWQQNRVEEHRAFGLRFTGVTQAEAEALQRAVRERTEGRAGAWPLPMMPDDESDYGQEYREYSQTSGRSRGMNPWLAAAAGMAAGVGLALAVSVIPNFGIDAPTLPEPPTSVTVAGPPGSGVAAPVPVAGSGVKVVDKDDPELKPQTSAALPPIEPAPEAALNDIASADAAEPVIDAAESNKPAPAPKTVAAAPVPTPAKTQTIKDGVLTPKGGGDRMALELVTDGPVDHHISFWLADPPRLVIDIPGRKSGFNRASYDVEHSLATKLRVGNHPGKVRFVLETASGLDPEISAERRGNSLFIGLVRKGG